MTGRNGTTFESSAFATAAAQVRRRHAVFRRMLATHVPEPGRTFESGAFDGARAAVQRDHSIFRRMLRTYRQADSRTATEREE